MLKASRSLIELASIESQHPIRTEDAIQLLRSLLENAQMIENHVASMHLAIWRTIDDLRSDGLQANQQEDVADVSFTNISELLTTMEVADMLGVSRATLLKMRKDRRFLEPIHLSARKLRYRRKDVEEWLERSAEAARNSGSQSVATVG